MDALESLDLSAAIEAEATSPPTLLPTTAVEQVLAIYGVEYSEVLTAELVSGVRLDEPEVLPAAKASRGRRPLSLLSPAQRVLYRALVDVLAPHLRPLQRGNKEYEVFKAAPLSDRWSRQIVMADVASCYQYIDHGILLEELLSIAAEPAVTQALGELIAAFSGQRFGLPQNRSASDVLADVVLDIPQRALLRSGLSTWRYNDDFRIAVADREHAHLALEDLERELRHLGLTLNDEKTSIREKESYQSWVSAIGDRLETMELQVEVDLTEFTEYDNEIAPEKAEVEVETALRLLEIWREDLSTGQRQFGPEAVVNKTLVRASLVALSQHVNEQGVDYVVDIMRHEPSLSPQVARYLAAIAATNAEGVDRTLDAIINGPDSFVSSWQALWLFESLNASASLTDSAESWLNNHQSSGRSDYVSSAAALTLARHRRISARSVSQMYNTAREASKPLLVAAMASVAEDRSDPLLGAAIAQRPLLEWIANHTFEER